MAENKMLTSADVARLLQDPSEDNRAETAAKVSQAFNDSSLEDSERQIVEEIFRVMLADAAVRVRSALSESLKENPNVPHDVASALAKDVDDVALPMIETSTVLTDDDLMAIIASKGSAQQKAVASRASVSSSVANELAQSGDAEVVATLVGNEGAEIGAETFETVIDRFGDNELVNAPMAGRSDLPINVAERLVTLVSDSLREHIITHHKLSDGIAADILLESREKATVSLLEGGGSEQDVERLVDQLYANKRLTPTLILRALCMGDVNFFEASLAKLCGIPVINAYRLVHDKGDMGLTKLFMAAKMPMPSLKIARAALSVAEEMNQTGGDDRDMFKQLMLERVLTAFELLEGELDSDNIDYLIGKLHKVETPPTQEEEGV